MPALITPIEMVVQDTDRRVDIYVRDAAGNAFDATELGIRVTTIGNPATTLLNDSFLPGPPTRIVKPAGTTGYYYVLWGDPTAAVNIPTQTETGTPRDLLVLWNATAEAGTEEQYATGLIRVISSRTAAMLPGFRLLIDKSRKLVSETPTDPCYTGYTDAMLVEFLWQGLSAINAYQPYPIWCDLDDFPAVHLQMLYESALLCGVMSQQLFAVDTDIESWCLPEGTGVSLSDGSRQSIESIEVGDVVLDRTGTPQIVTAAWDEGTPDELVEFTLWGGRKVQSTKNHKWPVWAWPRSCACGCGQNIKPGKLYVHGHRVRTKDFGGAHFRGSGAVGTPSRQCLPLGYDPRKKLRADEVCAKDFLAIPRRFSEVETDVTADEARMLGYFASEGHAVRRTVDSDWSNLSFTFGAHEVHTWVKDIQDFASKNGFSVRLDADVRTDKAVHVTTRQESDEARRLTSLARLHVGAGAKTKKLSEQLMRWPLELKLEFLKGCFRGDGSQFWSSGSKNGYDYRTFSVSYSTSSQHFAEQLELILAQLGIPCRVARTKAKKSQIDGRVINNNGGWVLSIPQPFATNFADAVWGSASKSHEFKVGRNGWKMPRPECLVDDDYVWIPIKAVETVKNDKPVYNLSVEGDHSYLADGLGTYNSNQGNSFVINHQPKLASFLQQIQQRLDRLIPAMKMHYVDVGTVRTQLNGSYRLNTVISAMPPGTTFRGIAFGS